MRYQKNGFCIPFLIRLLLVLNIYGRNSMVTGATALTTTEISNINDTHPLVYYVCGRDSNPTTVDCRCYDNTVHCFTYNWKAETFKNANIQILRPNFTAEVVWFVEQNFGILKKNETLPNIAPNVKFLQLPSNKITHIEDGTFDNFDALKVLSLSNNEITNLTSKVLTQKLGSTLGDLNLSGNLYLKISSIDFTYMTNLKWLNLGFNHDIGNLFATPSSWSFPKSLSNLTMLALISCNITHIPDNIFVNLLSLETLYLYDNPLTTYPKSLNTIPTLRRIDLSNTLIETLNQTLLGSNQYLNHLSIQESRIPSIDDCAFCGFTNLTSLHVSRSRKLSFIHENAFGHAKNRITPKIDSFSVDNCNLTVIPEKLFPWHGVKEIVIGGNPFNCSCEMAWLIDDILNPTHTMNLKDVAWYHGTAPLRCRYPLRYRNFDFFNVDKNYCKKPRLSQTPSAISGLVLFLIFASFIAAAIPICRYLLRLKKQKQAVFNYGGEESSFVNENFDNNNA